jgi:hypothetical protein
VGRACSDGRTLRLERTRPNLGALGASAAPFFPPAAAFFSTIAAIVHLNSSRSVRPERYERWFLILKGQNDRKCDRKLLSSLRDCTPADFWARLAQRCGARRMYVLLALQNIAILYQSA